MSLSNRLRLGVAAISLGVTMVVGLGAAQAAPIDQSASVKTALRGAEGWELHSLRSTEFECHYVGMGGVPDFWLNYRCEDAVGSTAWALWVLK